MSAPNAPFPELEETTITALQAALSTGQLTARQLVERYLARIAALDSSGPTLHSILETNPDALDIAEALDRERAAGTTRGPLHGIPILLKDNIDTADRMSTTAGSLALLGARPAQD
ncbi:MAG: amidase family protein, partial [Ktedonobacterales bacterium]